MLFLSFIGVPMKADHQAAEITAASNLRSHQGLLEKLIVVQRDLVSVAAARDLVRRRDMAAGRGREGGRVERGREGGRKEG